MSKYCTFCAVMIGGSSQMFGGFNSKHCLLLLLCLLLRFFKLLLLLFFYLSCFNFFLNASNFLNFFMNFFMSLFMSFSIPMTSLFPFQIFLFMLFHCRNNRCQFNRILHS
uniref:Candidate secreted effector n=1 Tax=Meloidogyne incognita TaxID=6306 RepID=A0A914MBY2_MELIC